MSSYQAPFIPESFSSFLMWLFILITVCPGGIQLPCSNRGRCIDGLAGDGSCICDSPFNGTACEQCINSSDSCPGTC